MATHTGTTFKVLDALDAPHGGRILRLRLQSGETPTLKALKGATLEAEGPRGEKARARVRGFAVMGGRPSDERLVRTGRVDLHIEQEEGDDPIDLQWDVSLS